MKKLNKYDFKVIDELMDLIKKLFSDDYANIVIIDSSNRQRHEAERLTVKELKNMI